MHSIIAKLWCTTLIVLLLGGSYALGEEKKTGDAAAQPAGVTENFALARVEGQAVTLDDMRSIILNVAVPQRADATQKLEVLVQDSINRKLVNQYAREKKLHEDAEFQKRLKAIQEIVLYSYAVNKLISARTTVTEEQVKAFYEQNKTKLFQTGDKVRAQHILFKTREDAEKARKEIEGGADFAKMATQLSLDKLSAPLGGDLGEITPGKYPPEFEKAAFSLEPGKLSEVIETSYGYHLLKVTKREKGREIAYEEAAAQIKNELKQKRMQQEYSAFIDELRHKANIMILPEEIARAQRLLAEEFSPRAAASAKR